MLDFDELGYCEDHKKKPCFECMIEAGFELFRLRREVEKLTEERDQAFRRVTDLGRELELARKDLNFFYQGGFPGF